MSHTKDQTRAPQPGSLPPPPDSAEAGGLRPFFASLEDAGELAALSRAAFAEEALTAATFRRRLRGGRALVLGLRDERGITAYLLLYLNARTRRAYVNEALVLPERRGQGLAAWLLRAAEAVARAEGMALLAAHVRVSNTPSLRAKLRQGMKQVYRLWAWYSDGEDALYLRQRL